MERAELRTDHVPVIALRLDGERIRVGQQPPELERDGLVSTSWAGPRLVWSSVVSCGVPSVAPQARVHEGPNVGNSGRTAPRRRARPPLGARHGACQGNPHEHTDRISLTLADAGLRFTARTGSGHDLVIDGAEGDAGPRPAELVAVAIAGCAAMDVISILRKKRQEIGRYEVKAQAEQRDGAHPAVFVRIDIIHVVDGSSIDVEAVRRAIELSATRYCSVGGTWRPASPRSTIDMSSARRAPTRSWARQR